MQSKIIASILFFVATLTLLLLLTNLPIYDAHMGVDINVFYNRANYFFENLSFKNLNNNEYQPGATLFFVLLSPILNLSNSFDTYRAVIFAANLVFLILLGFVYLKKSIYNLLLFSILILFTGPILFYRFDLLVSLLVVFSLSLWFKNKQQLAMILLAIATTVKIYPLLILPVLLIYSYRSSGITSSARQLLTYIATILLFILVYLILFQQNTQQLINGLNYHALKPVSTDNIYGLMIFFTNIISAGRFPELISAYGTNGFSNNDIFLPLWSYNYFWIVPFIGIHLLLFGYKRISVNNLIIFIVNILFIFLFFTKSIAPQYLIWYISLIPLLSPKILFEHLWPIIITLSLLSSFLYQYIYPLNYDSWLIFLRHSNSDHTLLVISIIRNILMVTILALLTVSFLRNRVVDQSNSRIDNQ